LLDIETGRSRVLHDIPGRAQTCLIFAATLGGAAKPADYVASISRILDALGDVARAHVGFIDKFTADGLLVVFGAPRKGKDMQAKKGMPKLHADASG
jgi:class 3 adenylate cyclase